MVPFGSLLFRGWCSQSIGALCPLSRILQTMLCEVWQLLSSVQLVDGRWAYSSWRILKHSSQNCLKSLHNSWITPRQNEEWWYWPYSKGKSKCSLDPIFLADEAPAGSGLGMLFLSLKSQAEQGTLRAKDLDELHDEGHIRRMLFSGVVGFIVGVAYIQTVSHLQLGTHSWSSGCDQGGRTTMLGPVWE